MEVATPARRPPARWVLSFACLIQQAAIYPRFVPSCACAVDYLTHMLPQYVRAAVGDALRSLPIPATAPVEVDAAPTAGADARPVLQAQVAYLRHILTALRDDARSMFMEWVPELLKRVVLGVVSPLKSALSAAKSEVSLLETANKRLSNDNLQLLERAHKSQGNIVVYVRIRPKTPFEAALDTGNNAARSGDAVSAMNTRASPTDMDELGSSPISLLSATELAFYDARGRSWRPFAFDGVLGPRATQAHVFREVEGLATLAISGHNGCIVAFGQTGSGKTYTMEGVCKSLDASAGADASVGISYRLVDKIFSTIQSAQAEQSCSIRVSMVEIYNEQLRDLLVGYGSSTTPAHPKLQIRQRRSGGTTSVHVPGLTRVEVSSASDVIAVLAHGNAVRSVASTNVHEHSSRSHSILEIEVRSRCAHFRLRIHVANANTVAFQLRTRWHRSLYSRSLEPG